MIFLQILEKMSVSKNHLQFTNLRIMYDMTFSVKLFHCGMREVFCAEDGANVKSLIISNSIDSLPEGVIFMKWLWFFTKPDKCFISCTSANDLHTAVQNIPLLSKQNFIYI